MRWRSVVRGRVNATGEIGGIAGGGVVVPTLGGPTVGGRILGEVAMRARTGLRFAFLPQRLFSGAVSKAGWFLGPGGAAAAAGATAFNWGYDRFLGGKRRKPRRSRPRRSRAHRSYSSRARRRF